MEGVLDIFLLYLVVMFYSDMLHFYTNFV